MYAHHNGVLHLLSVGVPLNQNHTPIILAGQIYLNDQINDYLIVTKSYRGQISYSGSGFKGNAEVESFLERFQPVDPTDVDQAELETLLSFCPAGTTASTGFILG